MKHFALLLSVFFIGTPSVASAQRLHMTIDDPNFKPYPIAVADVTDLSSSNAARAQGVEMTNTLRADLEFSPLFLPLNPKSFLASQHELWS